MPQMSPIMWDFILITVSYMIILMTSKLYFYSNLAENKVDDKTMGAANVKKLYWEW